MIMAKEEIEIRQFKKSFAYLNELIKKWYESLQEECKGKYCLAISRKAPRLLDWCYEKFNNPERMLIISELTLPFLKKTEKECIVVDEAIYHGTTFRNVLLLAKDVFEKVIAMPLVFTFEAMLNKEIRNHLNLWNIIDDNDCPFFINSIISKFWTLGKPYDIEYPLFYVEFDKDITEEQVDSALNKLVDIESEKRGLNIDRKYLSYSTQVYSREDRGEYFSYSYLTEYLYTHCLGRSKPELSKIRLQYKGNRLCIVSMSPHIISEADLNIYNSMLNGDLLNVWSKIYNAATECTQTEKEECQYQFNKSLVVMTNYLLSFANFLQIKDSLIEAFQLEGKSFSLERTDLIYLLGPDLAASIQESLETFLQSSRYMKLNVSPTLLSSEIEYSLIPSEFRDDYVASMSIDNLSSFDFTIPAMMSNMFSAMHWDIEIPSRHVGKLENYQRLHFGESYRSISDRFSFHYSDKMKLHSEIHQALDYRVTFGSVVPNYLCLNGRFSERYWMRMFRSGENEDFYKDQILRQLVSVFCAFQKFNKGSLLHLYELEFLLVLLAHEENQVDRASKKKRFLFGARLEIKFVKEMYKTYIHLRKDKEISLVDYALNYHVLELDDHQYLRLGDGFYAQRLRRGSLWTERKDCNIRSYANYIHLFMQKNNYPLYIREVLNYLCYKDDGFDVPSSYQQWKESLSFLIKEDCSVGMESMMERFVVMFNRFPEPYLRLTKEIETFNPAMDRLSAMLWKQMNLYKDELLKDSTFDKLMLSYYVLNLWSYYKDGVTARNFNINKYRDCLNYLERCSNDMYSWLTEVASMDKIKSLPLPDVQSRLSKLLTEVC